MKLCHEQLLKQDQKPIFKNLMHPLQKGELLKAYLFQGSQQKELTNYMGTPADFLPIYSSDPRFAIGHKALLKFRMDMQGQISRQASSNTHIALRKKGNGEDAENQEVVICLIVTDPEKIKLPYHSLDGVPIVVTKSLTVQA